MKLSLFTFIAEYEGGTYIQQLHANSAKAALKRYTREANWTDTRKLAEALEDEEPIEIEGITGVYCASAILKRRPLLLNFVLTVN